MKSIIDEYPGLQNSPDFKNGVQVIDATPDRMNSQFGKTRYSEYYNPGEKGGVDMLPNPGDSNKAVLEIYKPEYQKNPKLKNELILGELLHGMKSDPNWQNLRVQFSKSFSEDQNYRNQKVFTNWQANSRPGITFDEMVDEQILDSYIRAGFMPTDKNSTEWTQTYTPKQKQVLQQMRTYLKTKPAEKTSRQTFLGY